MDVGEGSEAERDQARDDDDDLQAQSARLGRPGRNLLGLFFAFSLILILALLICAWPLVLQEHGERSELRLGPLSLGEHGVDTGMLIVVMVLGAIGGCLHGLGSFAAYVGNRNLVRSWVWWYLLRIPVGMGLATLVYFVLRAGLLSPSAGTEALNPYGIATLAGAAGLSSEIATQKLREVFEQLFHPRELRRDRVDEHS